MGSGDEAKAGILFTADRGQENGSGRFGGNDSFPDGGDAGGAVGKTRLWSQIRRDHGKDTLDTGEGGDQAIVVVRDNEFDPSIFPRLCFGFVSNDATDLLSMLKKSVCDCTANVAGDSHDCEHRVTPWRLTLFR